MFTLYFKYEYLPISRGEGGRGYNGLRVGALDCRVSGTGFELWLGTLLGFTLGAKLVSSKHLTPVHLKI